MAHITWYIMCPWHQHGPVGLRMKGLMELLRTAFWVLDSGLCLGVGLKKHSHYSLCDFDLSSRVLNRLRHKALQDIDAHNLSVINSLDVFRKADMIGA